MASIATHLAIAKRFIEKNPGLIKDERAFYEGNVLPDLVKNKEETHYGVRGEKVDLIKRHKEKVNLQKFLEFNKLDTDENKGRFLHLYTDQIFFNALISHDYLRSVDLETFIQDFHYTIKFQEHVVHEYYGISYHEMTSIGNELEENIRKWDEKDRRRCEETGMQGKIVYSEKELLDFVESVSDLFLTFLLSLGDGHTDDLGWWVF